MSNHFRELHARRFLDWALVVVVGATSSVHAQSTARKSKACGNYATQLEMNQCAAAEAKLADEALNTTYQEFLAKLKGDRTATARGIAAERAWIAFRDAELASDWPVAQGGDPNIQYGSAHPFCYYNEFAALTRDRIKVLQGELLHMQDVLSPGVEIGQVFPPN